MIGLGNSGLTSKHTSAILHIENGDSFKNKKLVYPKEQS